MRRQCERDGHVGKVAKVTMRVFVHAVAFVSGRLVREIIEGLGAEMMASLVAQLSEVFNRRALVINAGHPQPTALIITLLPSRLRSHLVGSRRRDRYSRVAVSRLGHAALHFRRLPRLRRFEPAFGGQLNYSRCYFAKELSVAVRAKTEGREFSGQSAYQPPARTRCNDLI